MFYTYIQQNAFLAADSFTKIVVIARFTRLRLQVVSKTKDLWFALDIMVREELLPKGPVI